MKFAIRDDDICYFTSPKDLEKAYGILKDTKGPISLAVVPYTVSTHGNCKPYGVDKPGKFRIGDNVNLVKHLQEGVNFKKYDILLHGYSHEYKRINNKWVPEMLWKSDEDILTQIAEGKVYLENLFGTTISVFVAPNNAIDQKGIKVIEKLRMNYSGIIYFRDREISKKYIKNFSIRWVYRFIKKIPYGAVLDYGKHKEKYAYPLSSIERLKREYHLCKIINTPFILNTHYWDIIKEPSKSIFEDIIDYILSDGAELVSVSNCF